MKREVSAGLIRKALAGLGDEERARAVLRYFKAFPGGYGEGDVFLGISMPALRLLAKTYEGADEVVVLELLGSTVHEERMLALLVLIRRYSKGGPDEKDRIFDLYLKNTRSINNWDLVDASAPHIVGAHLLHSDVDLLYRLARSENLWERRIAVLSTLAFIRKGEFGHTLGLARMLLDDREDLMHKAVGWMLREVGKKDEGALRVFLDEHCRVMPRTMLRYAIERFPEGVRAKYLKAGKGPGNQAGEGAGHG